MRLSLALILVFGINHWALGYKILGLFPYHGRSHYFVFESLLKGLAAKGHEITSISQFPQKIPVSNFRDITINRRPGQLEDVIQFSDLIGGRLQQYVTPLVLTHMGYETCHTELPSKTIIEFVESKPHFDVIITELFNTQCFLGIAHRLKAPVVGITSCIPFAWQEYMLGFSNNPSYVPNHFMDFSERLTFLERVENTILYLSQKIMYKLVMANVNDWASWKYLGNDLPSTTEMVNNVSLVLVNNHFTYTTPKLTVPGYIEVGGMHVGQPKKLPENIEKWINESTHGVIYFSLGSMIKGHTFPEEKRQMFLKAFARLPQRVLWKWEKEMPGKPDNVMIQKWMPQFDILNHPNVKAFISHGGLLGTTEAVHCGVPMVIMPQYGDQFANARAVEISGGGVMLDFTTITEDIIYDALKKVLSSEFNTKAKDLSERFRDRPLPPLETAVYWVEYVARHKGAPHMRTAAVGMPLYQYLLLDVIAFLLVVFIVIIYSLYFVLKRLLRLFIKPKSKQKLKSN